MNPLLRLTPERRAKDKARRELPAGWSIDTAPVHVPDLALWVVCASGPGFRVRGGHGRTRRAAWEDLAHRLRERRVKIETPSRLAAIALVVSSAMLGLTMALPPMTVAETPSPTPAASLPAVVAWDPAAGATPAQPTLEVYRTPAPTRTITLPPGAPYFGRCPSPSTSTDRRRGNSPASQAYLRSRLSAAEYNCAWWIVLQESGWRPTALNWSGACGFPQSSPCSKLANWIAARHPDTCKPTRLPGLIVTWACDWRQYPTDQLDWMVRYVHGKYGSFLAAAMTKFGWTDAAGRHAGRGWF